MDLQILGYRDSRTLEKKRAQILTSSRKLFIDNSIEQVTMKEIAEESKITRRSLYNYYVSKDHIAVDVQILNLMEINFFHTWGAIMFHNDLKDLLKRMPDIAEIATGEFQRHYVLINRFDSYFNKGYPDSKYIDFIRNEATRIFSIKTEEFQPENFRTEWFQSNLLLSYIQRLSIRSMYETLSPIEVDNEIKLLCNLIIYSSE